MTDAPHKVRVLLADDHPIVRHGLRSLIDEQADMHVVGEASDGIEALVAVDKLHPEVVVVDVNMPRLNGPETAKRLREQAPHVRVLALTVHEDRAYLRMLLEAGAAGYTLKKAATETLVDAIRTVAAGGSYIDPTLAGSLLTPARMPTPAGAAAPLDLSEREEEVMQKIAQGYSNKEIAAHLDLSVKTIETYKIRALEKLGLRSRSDIVRYALQRGWLSQT